LETLKLLKKLLFGPVLRGECSAEILLTFPKQQKLLRKKLFEEDRKLEKGKQYCIMAY